MQKRKAGQPHKGWKGAARQKFAKCRHWPKCRCIVQGYVNGREPNNCGRKPARPQRAADLQTFEYSGA